MLKKLLNTPERITYGRLCEVCARHATAVYAKVRLADVLPIEGSGISGALYEFALAAHYDFVVAGRDQTPLFAVEFDGSQHANSPQAERDAKKDELSRRFGLPLMRVQAEDLYRTEWQRDKLTELIERWFADHSALSAGVVNMQAMPKCPLCGGEMQKKPGKFGPFLSCNRYPACTGACDLPESPHRIPAPLRRKIVIACLVSAAIVVALGMALLFKYQFGASKIPRAPSAMTVQEQWDYANALKPSDYPTCPRCGKPMVVRKNTSTGDPFFGCSDFPRCRGSRDVPFPR